MRRKSNLKFSLSQLAEQVSALNTPSPDIAAIEVSGICDLKEASASDIAFIISPKYLDQANASKACAFLTPKDLTVEGRPCLAVADVWQAVFDLIDLFWPDEPAPAGIHPSAVVDPSARLGANVSIGPLCVVEADVEIGASTEIGAQCFVGRSARIGESCLLHPNAKVLERVVLGNRVILHSGVVLGADGYGYKWPNGQLRKQPQIGTVILEDDVEVGANTCIDRATFSETRIGAGTKIDNLVQIAHNCHIGRMCGMASQVGFSGSVETGDFCMFWGQVGIADQLKIGNGVQVFAQSGVKDNIPDGARFFGYPAGPQSEMARLLAAQKQMPEALKRLRTLEKKIEKAEQS